MLRFEKTTEYSPYESNIFRSYFGNTSLGFFDIETTGLSPEKCKIILAGLAIPEGNTIRAIQLLAEDPSEEPILLKTLLDELDSLDMVVTYNGKHFDMPFVQKRCIRNKLHLNCELPYNLDLFEAVRHHSPLKGMLPNLKQKTLEDFLGLWESRLDEISGGDSVDLYYIYAGEKDEKLRDIILLHNHDDIMQLSKLIKILDRCDLHSYIFRNGFPMDNLLIQNIILKKRSLTLTGRQRRGFSDARYYGIPDISFDSIDRNFNIVIPLVYQGDLVLADMEAIPVDSDNTIEGYLILASGRDADYERSNELSMKLAEYAIKNL